MHGSVGLEPGVVEPADEAVTVGNVATCDTVCVKLYGARPPSEVTQDAAEGVEPVEADVPGQDDVGSRAAAQHRL